MLTLEIFQPDSSSPHPEGQAHPQPEGPADVRSIRIRMADGWTVSGHYRDNTLQTVTLRKPAAEESR